MEFPIPEDIGDKLSDPELFREQIKKGMTLQEILELTDEQLEMFYQAASTLYNENRLIEAVEAFTFLTTLNPMVANFWLGLGMAEQRIEEHGNALLAFAMAMMADDKSPLPHYQTALSYRALGEKSSALGAIELTLLHCRGDEWGYVKEKALELKRRITQEK